MESNEKKAAAHQVRAPINDAFKAVSDWLKFAEAKNAALIGVNIAGLLAVERLKDHLPGVYIFIVASCLIASIVVALLAVLPRVGWPLETSAAARGHIGLNLFFYDEIAMLSPDQYVKALEENFEGELTLAEKWLVRQTAVISRLTVSKLAYFRTGALLTLSALVTPIVVLIVVGSRWTLESKRDKPTATVSQ